MTGRKNEKQFFVENGFRFQIIKVRVGSLLKKTLGWSSYQRAIKFFGHHGARQILASRPSSTAMKRPATMH